ncbi:hypothetical protein ACIPW4_18960 [Pseudomonas sp. NPDC089996]|uniref:hypothetical protein n=1 Tax=Pseudomonas sp. NPDC089996 TaxID=3364474 RepID=UPI0037F64071
MPSSQPLVLAELTDSTRAAAEAFIAAGTAANAGWPRCLAVVAVPAMHCSWKRWPARRTQGA